MTERRRCRGRTRSGALCKAPAVGPDGWCWYHHPERAEERAEARRRGGLARAEAARAAGPPSGRLGAALDRLEATWDALEAGETTPDRARAAAALAEAMATVEAAAGREAGTRITEAAG